MEPQIEPSIDYYEGLVDPELKEFLDDEYIENINVNIVEYDPIGNAKNSSGKKQLIKLFKKEIKQSFVDRPGYGKFIKNNIGSVAWKKMEYFEWENSRLAFLPVANKKSTKTKALIVVFKQKGEEIRYFVQKRNKLSDLSTKKQERGLGMEVDQEFMITQFMLADKATFDTSDCKLIERLSEIINGKSGNSKTTVCHWQVDITSYTDYWTCPGSNPVFGPPQLAGCIHQYSTPNYGYVLYCQVIPNNYGSNNPNGGGNGSTNPTPDDIDPCDDSYTGLEECEEEEECAPGFVKNANGECVESVICKPGYEKDANGECVEDDEKLNKCELLLISQGHGTCALYLKTNRTIAFQIELAMFNAIRANADGCGDAFRHAYFNALNAKDCGIAVAKLFGDAHECDKDSFTDNATHMDLSNNKVGPTIYANNPLASDEELAELVMEALRNNKLLTINENGNLTFYGKCF